MGFLHRNCGSAAFVPRVIALAAAFTALAGLGIQLGLLIQTMAHPGAALWRFLGYFTIIANLLAAIVANAMAFRPQSALASPRARLAALVAIVIVGIVYSVALRRLWNPQGWQAVADHLLHDMSPPLFALLWLVAKHGTLGWRDAPWALALPAAYCSYALARGAMEGWYAYWFLDAGALAPVQLLVNILVLLCGFAAVAVLAIAVDRRLGRG